jgi:hypothetical protein
MPPAFAVFAERDPPLDPKDVRPRLPRLLIVILSGGSKRTSIGTPSYPCTLIAHWILDAF